jgi:hypothetical protein
VQVARKEDALDALTQIASKFGTRVGVEADTTPLQADDSGL